MLKRGAEVGSSMCFLYSVFTSRRRRRSASCSGHVNRQLMWLLTRHAFHSSLVVTCVNDFPFPRSPATSSYYDRPGNVQGPCLAHLFLGVGFATPLQIALACHAYHSHPRFWRCTAAAPDRRCAVVIGSEISVLIIPGSEIRVPASWCAVGAYLR